MEKKLAYERPELCKVRLDIKTSVLADCHTSFNTQGDDVAGCMNITPQCYSQQ